MKTFQTVNDELLIELINRAKSRLVFMAPGVRKDVARALVSAIARIENVCIVLDTDAEICRMGYGDIEGLKLLHEIPGLNGQILNSQPGLRIGVVITDEDTLCYSPTPLLLEEEPSSGSKDTETSKPNGIMLKQTVSPSVIDAVGLGETRIKQEVGLDPINGKDVERLESELKETPPKQFDLARQERVFNSKICFLELEITGYKIQSKTMELPPELFVSDPELRASIRNRFKVFNESSLPQTITRKLENGEKRDVSYKAIADRIKDIRENYLVHVGKWGTVITRADLEVIKKEIVEIVEDLASFKSQIADKVKESARRNVKALVEDVFAKLKASPPPMLRKRLSLLNSTDDDVVKAECEKYLDSVIEKQVIDAVRWLKPEVKCVDKDITYTTFSDPEFRKLLDKGFGEGCLERVLSIHMAVPEKVKQ